MKISENWLREWVNPQVSTQELGERLTMAGLELDGIEPAAPDLTGVIVAKIKSTAPHPDAKKLQVCQVDVGDSQTRQIVCGAKNARPGLTVALATEGAELPGGIIIAATKLRGVQSFGMICSSNELGLDEDAEGILELDEKLELGMPLTVALKLNDAVYDIDLTPNRSDCLSVQGVAREVSALYKVPVNKPELNSYSPETDQSFPVEVQANRACPHYCGRVIVGVNANANTPVWMKEYLRRSGIRSISIIVDICNYVMLELGQPMHAFDLDKVSEKVVVRMAQNEEKLELLDGKEVTLSNEHLVIADADKVLALAGIMGGNESAVQLDTKNIFLESAYFDLLAIAGKARQFGLHTESSHRFERGVDPELAIQAMERATTLIKEFAVGDIGPITNVVNEDGLPKRKAISLPIESIQNLLGVNIEMKNVISMFESLDCVVDQISDRELTITPPSYRFDLEIEQDLIEEVARLCGYDQFPTQALETASTIGSRTSKSDVIFEMQKSFISLGYNEAVTFSFTEKEHCALFAIELPKELANPISTSLSHMRTSLWPGLCMAANYNLKRQQSSAKLFEIGRKYLVKSTGLEQTQVIAGVSVGELYPRQWGRDVNSVDFYDVKGHLEQFLEERDVLKQITFRPSKRLGLHPGKSAEILFNQEIIGILGVLHPSTAKSLDLANREVVVFELDFSLDWLIAPKVAFKSWSKFPQVHRDLSILVAKNVSVQSILDEIYALQIEALQDIEVFSLYQGKGVPEDLKSISLGLILQDFSSTLTDENVEQIITNIISLLGNKFEAQLRSA